MFQFGGFASRHAPGYPSRDGLPHSDTRGSTPLAGPRGFSQLGTSFFAPWSPGIPRAPFSTCFAPCPLLPGTAPDGTPSPRIAPRTGGPPHIRFQHVNELPPGKTRKSETIGWNGAGGGPSRKEVFQPHLPVRLPCYDLAPVTGFTLNGSSTVTAFRSTRLPWLDGRCVQGPGTYSPRHG